MRVIALALVTSLVVCRAQADAGSVPATAATSAETTSRSLNPPGLEPPRATEPHVCGANKYYTRDMVLSRLQGSTKVGFDITADGTVANIAVVTSSGSKELDDAVIDCVGHWRYIPAMKGGIAVSVPWLAIVTFNILGGGAPSLGGYIVTEGPAAPAQTKNPASVGPEIIGRHVCEPARRLYSFGPPRAPTNSTTTLQFEITPDGSVSDVSVKNSSGSQDRDAYVVECVKKWRYKPAMKDGVAVSVPWTIAVKWSALGILPPVYWENVVLALQKCAKRPAPTEDQLKDIGATVLVIQFEAGFAPNVSLVRSSGNKELDDRAISCVRSMPADLVGGVPDKERDEMAFNWKFYRLWRTW